MSGLRCKPGDLAVIIGTTMPQHSRDIGAFVGVLEKVAMGEFFAPDMTPWRILGDDSWLVKSIGQHRFSTNAGASKYAIYGDPRLKPIRPGAPEESETRTEPEKEPA